MQHPTRRAAWEARHAATIRRLGTEPYSPALAAAAIAARMELRRRLTAEQVATLTGAAA